MAPGDVYEATDLTDVYYVDTGMYGTPKYGAVYCIDAAEPALVDTGIGTNYEYIEGLLDEVGVDREAPLHILATHVHLDHAGGAGFLAEDYPNADVYVHEIGAPHLADPSRLVKGTKNAVGEQWEYYVDPKPVPEDRIVELSGGETLDLGDRELDVHHAPGHAPHQVIFHDPEDEAVYAADAAGIYVPQVDQVEPTSPPSNFDLEQVVADAERIKSLDPEVLCYAHYGPAGGESGGVGGPDARADAQVYLDEYIDVIQAWVDDIEAVWRENADDTAVVEHFAERAPMEGVWGEQKASAETAMNVRGVLRYLKTREDD